MLNCSCTKLSISFRLGYISSQRHFEKIITILLINNILLPSECNENNLLFKT